eukprot:8366425-Pyramimonas_sp.AAC.1
MFGTRWNVWDPLECLGPNIGDDAGARRYQGAYRMQQARVYSHDGPIRCSKRGYILMTDQSDAVSAGISRYPKTGW